MVDAEQRTPGVLWKISSIAKSADPLTLYAQIQVLTAMRRSVLRCAAVCR
jgi:hypothetical protein